MGAVDEEIGYESLMAAEEGGGGGVCGADVAAGDDASGGVAEGGRLIGLPCESIARDNANMLENG